MDSQTFQEHMAAVEAASRNSDVKPAVVVHELDRLAEHLVGENAPEAQTIKEQVQHLISQLVPERHDVPQYVAVYCGGAPRY